MSDLKTSNVNIGLTKEELELAKANPEVFVEYLNYKKDILKSIDAERLAHEKEIELQKVEVERSKLEIEKSKIEHEKTYEMFEGDLPAKAQELVTEWLSLHSTELQEMWDKQIITKLPPL